MQLQLKNIGMIKEATVKIDGLTVIAGENDTGKSTVGKALYYSYIIDEKMEEIDNNAIPFISEGGRFQKEIQENVQKNKKNIQKNIQEKIFYFQLADNSIVNLDDKIKSNVIFIDTPILTNFFDFFSILDTIQHNIDYIINNYPYLSRSLYMQLKLELKKETTLDKYEQLNILKEIIGGELKTDAMGQLVFSKENGSIHNVNAVATGIKNFGILQLLLKNNYLTKDAILIIDEPEVHLHPKWQLQYAKFIVNLVKDGVKVFINSHSPYMIEALKRYSDKEKLQDKTNFYLASDGIIEDKNKLQEIYEKLSEPFDEFDKMDSDILNGK